ncbi:MAG: cytochrome c oxidase subunit 3 [Anaerolineae bacterium]|nr:cytochrome c oxidase subunit 3 [Anaerolineae bacterium]MCA9908038.1 cytochrome c oxidase subunit 3 [Anaerolineae bacterium]
MAQNVAEQGLSRDELIALRNKRTGMTVFQISWIMVFVCLIVVNWQIRGNSPAWPPAGVEPLPWALPTIVTILLVVSGWLVHNALQAINANQLGRFFGQWRAALVLGAVFVAVIAFEWITIPTTGQYSTVFRVMTAYHAVHAVAIGLYMWYVDGRVRSKHVTARDTWAVEAGMKLWYFVIAAWIMFYVVLYVL